MVQGSGETPVYYCVNKEDELRVYKLALKLAEGSYVHADDYLRTTAGGGSGGQGRGARGAGGRGRSGRGSVGAGGRG